MITTALPEENNVLLRQYLNALALELSEEDVSVLLNAGLDRLREEFLAKLLSHSGEQIQELDCLAEFLDLPKVAFGYQVCTFQVDLDAGDLRHDVLLILLGSALKRDLNQAGFHNAFCVDREHRLCCLVSLEENDSLQDLKHLISALVHDLTEKTSIKVLCGIGPAVATLPEVGSSRDGAILDMWNINSGSRVAEFHFSDGENIQAYLLRCFRAGNLPELSSAMRGYLAYIHADSRSHAGSGEELIFTYLQNVTKECTRVGVSPERFDSYVPTMSNLLQADIAVAAESAIRLSEQIIKYISVHRTSETNHLLNMAKAYILEHLGDERLDLEAVSRHVGLSRVYFCKLFHQLEGINFNTYLKNARIEKAKSLLISTNMKVFEISNAVGFSHAKYFGTVFRQTVGMTPVEYQKSTHE